jgi:two-component system, cell cycle sensor histidine kinase and response regulator CckA
MKESLSVLYAEDSALDAELVQSLLEAEGIKSETLRVETRAQFVGALEKGKFDLVLSDYNLPGFGGISALEIAREKCPEIPFIFISGSIGEEVAIETLKRGATDYVLKHRLARLVPSVRRALEETDAQKQRRHLEEQLRQSQKMEAIGRLAGGIAHDFNNLLTAIIGYSQLLLSRLPEGDPPMKSELEEIEKAGKRAASLTSQLLSFSRKQVLQPEVLDLRTVISELARMLTRVIGEDINLINIPGPRSACVRADPGQIEQIIMNLVVNARDAMPRGGNLTIETSVIELDGRSLDGGPILAPGPYVLLSVTDTGFGIDKETQARIFEPFFTTKPAGKGTGLGLSTVYGIVRQSGGDVLVCSKPSQGTTFKIYLPQVDDSINSTQEPAVRIGPHDRSETILLVEDEEIVRKLAREVLKTQGYTVLEACDGDEAMTICQQQGETIDLMLTDVVMPRLGGRELARRALSLRPEMKVICMSGYTDDVILQNGSKDASIAFLPKPFTPIALARKVREVLDS